MRKAITTSILSTRWRLIWTFVPTLDFEDNWSCFFNISFTFVLESILAQRKGKCIKRLCLSKYNKHSNLDLISTMVSTAVA
uniref:Uncharacterized protein n=1 Tax=Cajanus cajan TaxID=3821 RepID=A0A151QW87_CAJCA|nr:hypothetical protein KK1_044398 [Cajanus cajan]